MRRGGQNGYHHQNGIQVVSSSAGAQIRRTNHCTAAENAQLLKTDYVHNPFYTQRYFITKPAVLLPHTRDNSASRRSHSVQFTIPFDWWQKVSNVGEKYELIVRVYETKKPHIDYLPHDIKAWVNERSIQTPAMVPASHADVKPRPQAKPLILSQCLKPRTSNMQVQDTLKLGWYHCDGKKGRPTPQMSYIICIVREYTHAEATDRIRRLKRPREIDITKRLLRQKASLGTGDDAIQQVGTKMNLRCPITMMPITEPVRFDNCEHLDCFDAANYLRMNSKKPAWSCPICNKRLPFGTLRIDKWFEGILGEAGASSREVELDPHGNFKITDRDEDDDDEDEKEPAEIIEL